MRFVKGFLKKRKRQRITVLSALFIVYSIAAAGIFSYFHGSDVVTNKLSSENGSVAVSESEWFRKGRKMAAASEPGMVIPKDPSAFNDGPIDIYVRIKMTIRLGTYSGFLTNGIDTLDGELGIPSNARRNRGIISALRIDGKSFMTGTEEAITDWGCNNGDYVFAETEQDIESNKLVFYYYYTAGDKSGGDDVMRVLKPGESTSELFTELEIPVYKHEYLGIFDQNYDIDIQAEAIPARLYEEAPKVDDVIADFDSN